MLSNNPTGQQQTLQTAIQHHQAGRLPQAEAIYRQILAADPRSAAVLHLLGLIARQTGHAEPAVDLMTQAIAARPNFPEALSDLAVNLIDLGRFDQAIGYCKKAIALRPDFAEAHTNLGNALMRAGRLDEAILYSRKALTIKPNLMAAHNNLGCALRDKGQFYEASACFRKVIALRPDFAEAHTNLGNVLKELGMLDESISCCRNALAINPNLPAAHNNLGCALGLNGQFNEAIACLRKAITLNPEYVEGNNNLSNALLLVGEFAEGWDLYEWRWKVPGFERLRASPQTRWNVANLPGGTLLLSAEQGFGDTIQFVRYAKLAAERCGKVLLECHPELVAVLRGVEGLAEVMPFANPPPKFDAHCLLLSLPRIFGTRLDSIPASVPYLNPDPDRAAAWSARVAPERRFKVGLSWAGRPTHKGDRHRSIPLASFAALANIPGVVFYSLQKGPAAQQSPPAGMELIDLTAELHDFADTAALIANLDLVISVDTAIVHLTGAMARPVWTLLPFSPDWRWLLDRTDSPWYPTMRLFRQPAIGEWESVLKQVADELSRRVSESSASTLQSNHAER